MQRNGVWSFILISLAAQVNQVLMPGMWQNAELRTSFLLSLKKQKKRGLDLSLKSKYVAFYDLLYYNLILN